MKIKRRSFIQSISATIAAFTIGVSVAFPSTKKVEVKPEEEKTLAAIPCIELLEDHLIGHTGPWKDWDPSDHDSFVHATPEFIQQLKWEICQANDAGPWRKFDGWDRPSLLMFGGRPFKPYIREAVLHDLPSGFKRLDESRPIHYYQFIDGKASLNDAFANMAAWKDASCTVISTKPRKSTFITYRPTQLNQGEQKWQM